MVGGFGFDDDKVFVFFDFMLDEGFNVFGLRKMVEVDKFVFFVDFGKGGVISLSDDDKFMVIMVGLVL